jgi:hypothetical protein
MMQRHRQRGQVLILLGMWLFFGGGASSALVVYDGSTSDMKKAVKRVIKDEDRKDVILSYLSYWKSSQKKLDKQVSADRKQLFKTLRRQDAQRSDLEPFMAALDESFLKMDRDFLDWRFRVKDVVTSAEWAEIVARPN